MDSFILHYIAAWQPLAYIIIFLGMIIEGDIILFAAAFLAYQGVLESLPVFLTALWGMIFGDNLWYSLGRKIKKSSSSAIGQWAEKLAAPFDNHLLNNPTRTIFIAKFTYGFNRAVIVRAGQLKLKWKQVEESDILATLLWMAIVGGLGYLSGTGFIYAKYYLKFGEIALVIALIIFLIGERLLTKKFKKEL